ncbi:MAG: N-acetylglucosamine-6-phosphate deacetylase [Clostridiales bacterium]|nr:N-acetylglucosamine-6-phosphate deacetylase [Clostridiales bacterium]
MKCLINGPIVLKDRVAEDMMIIFDDTIREIVPADATRTDVTYIDAAGKWIAPGLIDVHSHGCVGEDATTSDAEGIRRMCRSVATDGVTSWLPTLMTYPLESLGRSFDLIRGLKKESVYDKAVWGGAEILGVNMEGPFISTAKKGAHLEEYIIPPDKDFVMAYTDIIRLITLAPELEGAMDLIRELTSSTETRVAVGHTAIGYEEALEAFDAGATEVTHLFNAMNGIHHRNPGLVGAALTRKDAYCELIADTFHINKGLFQLVADCKKDHLVLITDSMRAAGLPDGSYDLGGQMVQKEGIRCLLPNGTIAGSVLRLNQAVHNLYTYTDLSLPEAICCASLHPARAIGVDRRKGSIEPGKDADLILIDEDMNIYRTITGGETIYEN